jgi:hypothetical protein
MKQTNIRDYCVDRLAAYASTSQPTPQSPLPPTSSAICGSGAGGTANCRLVRSELRDRDAGFSGVAGVSVTASCRSPWQREALSLSTRTYKGLDGPRLMSLTAPVQEVKLLRIFNNPRRISFRRPPCIDCPSSRENTTDSLSTPAS